MAYYRCEIEKKESKESIYQKAFTYTYHATASQPTFDIDLSSIPVYKNISTQNIHFMDIIGRYDTEHPIQNSPGNFAVYSSLNIVNYNQNTGILRVTFAGVARLWDGKVYGTVIIIT